MWGSPGHVRLRYQINLGDFLGPAMLVTGPGFDGNPPVWPRTLVLDDPSQADEMVAEYQAQGYDLLKIYNGITAEASMVWVQRAWTSPSNTGAVTECRK